MAAILFEIDSTSEDASNVSVILTDTTWRVMEMDVSPPEIDPMFASSADTEGDPFVQGRHKNRTISLTLLAKTATDQLTQTAVQGLMMKLDKMRREGGTLKWTTGAGTVVVADVLFAQVKPEITPELYIVNKAVRVAVDFECKPYLRGAAVQLGDHAETSLPAVVGVDTSVGGDVPAAVRLLIDEDQGVDQWWLVWGIQSRYYSSSANAALYYEAEGRTAAGGSAIAAGPTGASGAGSNVMRNTALASSYQAILSTQATGGGAHLSHIGDFVVFARFQTPTTNTGAVSVAFEWAEGDFHKVNRNAEVTFPVDSWDGSWRLVELGQVHLTQVVAGTQRWEGRILAKSTVAGDDIDIDYLMLVPATEGSGRVNAVWPTAAPTSFIARDEFDQAAGSLAGKTAPVGGTWAGAGDADDFATAFTLDGRNVVTRSAISDTSLVGRYAISGASALAAQVVQIDWMIEAAMPVGGAGVSVLVIGRYIDTSNYFAAGLLPWLAQPKFAVAKKVAGSSTNLAQVNVSRPAAGAWYTLRIQIDAAGNWAAWHNVQGATLGEPLLTGQDSVLATAGTLASGKPGFYDEWPTATASARDYDNFACWVPVTDAAAFASQSIELRSDRAVREDSGGTLWVPPSTYEGDYPTVPPAGKEARSVRVIVKASRGMPGMSADSGIDDISYRMTVTPRYLVLPA